MFIYGTAWKEDKTQACVEAALAAGFRAIDTANQRKHYYEAGVGAALNKVFSESRLKREDLFLQTKFTFLRGQDERLPYDPKAPLPEQVKQSFTSSLEHLGTDFLDSYILHSPSGSRGLVQDDWQVWGAMEKLHQEGKAKNLGISNVNLEQLASLYEKSRVKPSYVQNRCYASKGWDKAVRTYCLKNQIAYQGFSLLTANQEIFKEPKFLDLLKRVGCTAAQAIFKFSFESGMLPLTGTTDPAHMREDLKSSKVDLSTSDIQLIEELLT